MQQTRIFAGLVPLSFEMCLNPYHIELNKLKEKLKVFLIWMLNVQRIKQQQVLQGAGWELGLQNVLHATLRPTKVESVTIFMGVNSSSCKWQCCKYNFLALKITPV